jgi:hypothetical protein
MLKTILLIQLLTAACFAGVVDEKAIRGGRITGLVLRSIL